MFSPAIRSCSLALFLLMPRCACRVSGSAVEIIRSGATLRASQGSEFGVSEGM